jgi:hypothetical protein
MFKKFAISLVLVSFASPARAIDEAEAFYYGARLGSTVCESIWNGASSMRSAYMKAYENSSIAEKGKLIANIENARGSENQIVKYYHLGSAKELMKCLPEIEKLPDYIRDK